MTKDQEDQVSDASPEPVEGTNSKRKRKSTVPSDEELEIDVNLPEPPSKKAKREALKKERREKKQKTEKPEQADPTGEAVKTTTTDSTATTKRSDHGIWIGNLPWTATKDSLRTFLRDQGSIEENDIVRVHMPPPIQDKNDRRPNKPQNKGFAYVDFTSKAVLEAALELTEQLMGGRKVLIKNAKSFEGRPDKPKPEEGQAATAGGGKPTAKPPTKRVFVGNLDFMITRDDVREHFSQAGEVEDVFLATFEDSGKCKGYGWIRFADVQAAEAAVRGFVYKRPEGDEDGEEEESGNEDTGSDNADGTQVKGEKKKKNTKRGKEPKRRKWFINRLHGREMRREFAEDSSVRYSKRFGKQANQQRSTEETDPGKQQRGSFSASREKRERPAKKFDARKIAPAKALSNAPRASTAIVAGAGKKVTFDE